MTMDSTLDSPKTHIIWMYWHDGWANTSIVVNSARQSWLKVTGKTTLSSNNFTVVFLDKMNMYKYLGKDIISIREMDARNTNKLGMSHLSDLIRLALLNQHGGIWVDATVFCNKPLNQWLVPIIEKHDFFAFDKPGGGRMLSSWFLFSKPNGYIVSKWLNASMDYIQTDPITNVTENYYWLHCLFGDLYSRDERFKLLWDNTTKISADGPHTLQHSKKMTHSLTPEMKQTLDESEIPVYKLTWKMNQTLIQPDTMLYYLFESHGIGGLPAQPKPDEFGVVQPNATLFMNRTEQLLHHRNAGFSFSRKNKLRKHVVSVGKYGSSQDHSSGGSSGSGSVSSISNSGSAVKRRLRLSKNEWGVSEYVFWESTGGKVTGAGLIDAYVNQEKMSEMRNANCILCVLLSFTLLSIWLLLRCVSQYNSKNSHR